MQMNEWEHGCTSDIGKRKIYSPKWDDDDEGEWMNRWMDGTRDRGRLVQFVTWMGFSEQQQRGKCMSLCFDHMWIRVLVSQQTRNIKLLFYNYLNTHLVPVIPGDPQLWPYLVHQWLTWSLNQGVASQPHFSQPRCCILFSLLQNFSCRVMELNEPISIALHMYKALENKHHNMAFFILFKGTNSLAQSLKPPLNTAE